MRRYIQVLLLAAAWAAGLASADAQVQLGKRYEDRLNGYSLRPPADGERLTDPTADYQARWTPKNITTDEVPWTLTTSNWLVPKAGIDIRGYAKILQESLQRQKGMKLAAPQFARIQGFDVVQLTGVVTGRVTVGATGGEEKLPDLDFYELIVLLKPTVVEAPTTTPASQPTTQPAGAVIAAPAQFLEVKLVTETRLRDQARGIWTSVVRSLELNDPTAAARRHEAAAQRTAELLWPEGAAGVEAMVRRAIPSTPQWYLVSQGEKTVGWMRMAGGAERQGGKSGFGLGTWAMIQLPGQQMQLVRRAVFTTPDLKEEAWDLIVQTGSGEKAGIFTQTVQRVGSRFFTVTGDTGKPRTTDIPPQVMAVYLPRALSPVVPAILQLDRPGEYVFGEYDEAANTFAMRTVTIVGPEAITIGGKAVNAIRLQDRPTSQSDTKTLWVTPAGRLLKSEMADGMTTVAVDEPTLVRTYPKAPAIVAELNKLAKSFQDEPVLDNPKLRRPRRPAGR